MWVASGFGAQLGDIDASDHIPIAVEATGNHSTRTAQKYAFIWVFLVGGADGNRTRVTCLGSRCSTIELQPRKRTGAYASD